MIRTYHIDKIGFNRQLELDMLDGGPQDLARIGVELGYTVAQQNFGLKDLVIGESPRGLELYPRDRKAVIRTRMVDLRRAAPERRSQVLGEIVNQAVAKLNEDFSGSSATVGYGFVSYFEEDKAVKMDIVEIPRS